MAEIAYDSVSKVYPDGTQAVHDLDLEIQDAELMVLVGPSGCGKTTALRMLAGLEEISDGEISVDGEVVNDVPVKVRFDWQVPSTTAIRWEQSFSYDEGRTWKPNWLMESTRDA